MEPSPAQRGIVIIVGMIAAFFLANVITFALLSPFRMDDAVRAVAGFLLFAVIFLLIIRGIEKITGMVMFAFNLK